MVCVQKHIVHLIKTFHHVWNQHVIKPIVTKNVIILLPNVSNTNTALISCTSLWYVQCKSQMKIKMRLHKEKLCSCTKNSKGIHKWTSNLHQQPGLIFQQDQ